MLPAPHLMKILQVVLRMNGVQDRNTFNMFSYSFSYKERIERMNSGVHWTSPWLRYLQIHNVAS